MITILISFTLFYFFYYLNCGIILKKVETSYFVLILGFNNIHLQHYHHSLTLFINPQRACARG